MLVRLAKGNFGTPRDEKRYGLAAFALGVFVLAVLQSATHAQNSGIPCQYEVTHIIKHPFPCPLLGPGLTQGAAISPNGRWVVGFYRQCSTSSDRGFIYDTQTQQFMSLPNPTGAFTSFVNDVNDEGLAVGEVDEKGFIYDINTGQFTYLLPGVPSGGTCKVNAINSSGMCCGTRTIQTGPVKTSAFLYSPETGIVDIGLINGESTLGWDISESGKVVGHFPEAPISANARAFIHEAGRTTVLPPIPGGINSRTRRCARTGEVLVDGHLTPSGPGRSFLYDNDFASVYEIAAGCTGGGPGVLHSTYLAVGAVCPSGSPHVRGAVWFGTKPRILNEMIVPPQSSGWVWSASDVSQQGSIVALVYAAQNQTWVLAPVPRQLGDTDCNGTVNVNDLLNVINSWGPCSGCDADLNGDHLVNSQDLLQVVFHWTH